MSLLEVIANASINLEPPTKPSKYPFILNPEGIYPNLSFESEDPNDQSLVKPVIGWEISKTDSLLMESSRTFYKKLKRILKNTRTFNHAEFTNLLTSFLENNGEILGFPLKIDQSDKNYPIVLISKLGFSMGRDAATLVSDACFPLKDWEILDCLIANRLIQHSNYSNLVTKLIANERSDLVVQCVKHLKDLKSLDVLSILKYFLSTTTSHESPGLENVRREWENEGLRCIEKGLKASSILIMMAHDEFSDSELCLHYLVSSVEDDDVILAPAISKLGSFESVGLIRYLGKWVRKYGRFPEAGGRGCLDGVKICEWIPGLEDVVRWLGVAVDEHFLALVLNVEFHEELSLMKELVDSMGLEARLCSSVANVLENLSVQGKDL